MHDVSLSEREWRLCDQRNKQMIRAHHDVYNDQHLLTELQNQRKDPHPEETDQRSGTTEDERLYSREIYRKPKWMVASTQSEVGITSKQFLHSK